MIDTCSLYYFMFKFHFLGQFLYVLWVQEWDLTSAEEAINVLREHNSNVTCLAVSPNMLYSGSLDCNEIFYRAIEDTSSVGVDCVRISQHSDSIL
jgi:hypothetical protein